jgi:5-(carboxyamino)imidazole ribonucleotide synthase
LPKNPIGADRAMPRLGIVGGGQLGRMLALAAAPLGIECRFIDPSTEAGAKVAAGQIVADFDHIDALIELAEWSDFVTFEFENVPAPALDAIVGRATLAPSPRSLAVSQDRLAEKQLFTTLGFPVAPYREVESLGQLEAAITDLGTPAILKTRRLGYDGKGQAQINSPEDAAHAWKSVGAAPSVVERRVEFKRELSVVVVRGADESTIWYPLAENVHRSGVLHTSRAPATDVDESLVTAAVGRTIAIAQSLGHVGALTLELFDTGDELILNEIAPRVHNSGHWTLDGAGSSQFENHVRAVTGLPLGVTAPVNPSVMVNFVGGVPDTSELLAIPGTHLHLYDKEPRPGRKVGHANVIELGGDNESLEDRAAAVVALADAAWR